MSGIPEPRTGGCALVTGASSGIGAAIARELAGRGHTIVLVARRTELLEQLAAELDVATEVVSCDLTDPAAREGLIAEIAARGLEVDVLVNNAGFATGGPFVESDPPRELDQVRVLCEAPVHLCSAFVPGMVERRAGAVLTVASTAGMQPLPWSAGYSAAKAHALTFAEALHHEVRSSGVSVTALCPGPVRTEFWEAAGGDQPIESSVPGPAWVSAEDAAHAGVEGLAKRRRVVVPGLPMRAVMLAGEYVPHAVKLPAITRLMKPR